MQIYYKIKNFMAERNGFDKLSIFLFLIYFLISAVKSFLRGFVWVYAVMTVIQLVFLGYILFRIFSKNLQKRYNENFKFEQIINAWKPYANHLKLRVQYFKSYRFRTCAYCGEFLRLKKGRGKRIVNCPKCGKELKFHFLF